MHTQTSANGRAPAAHDFQGRIIEACRLVLSTSRQLTHSQRQRLYDVIKGRYDFKTVRELLDASATCAQLGAVTAIPEAFRYYALSLLSSVPLCERETYDRETHTQARGDIAQARYFSERTRPNRDAAIYDLTEHYEALRQHRDALLHRAASEARPMVVVR